MTKQINRGNGMEMGQEKEYAGSNIKLINCKKTGDIKEILGHVEDYVWERRYQESKRRKGQESNKCPRQQGEKREKLKNRGNKIY